MTGYAVVDLETTGIHPGWHERIVEVAVVQVSTRGVITGVWETLINPGRDLGPQRVHGIRAAEILRAPTFEQIAGELAALLRGRVVVAHNLRFDAGFLAAEYLRCGHQVPIAVEHGLCTMGLAHRYLPGSGRSLADCCAAFGITVLNAHRASADATAAAELLVGYLGLDPGAGHWRDAITRAVSLVWPPIASSSTAWLPREQARQHEQHFLTRLVERLPDPGLPDQHAAYLATLDQALLDRHISVTESDGLVAIAAELGMGRSAAQDLHVFYARQLAEVAWADGVITPEEREDLHSVGTLLGICRDDIDRLLAESRSVPGHTHAAAHAPAIDAFALSPGDLVVFTGEMSRLRSEWEQDAAEVGLVPHGAVTKKVALLVAADPDSLSGKARKARDYGIPVVTEDGFARMLAEYQRVAAHSGSYVCCACDRSQTVSRRTGYSAALASFARSLGSEVSTAALCSMAATITAASTTSEVPLRARRRPTVSAVCSVKGKQDAQPSNHSQRVLSGPVSPDLGEYYG